MKTWAAPVALPLEAASALAAAAQGYPNRIAEPIVAFPPGRPVDVKGRLIAQRLSAALGWQAVLDNHPGTGGTLAGQAAAAAKTLRAAGVRLD